MDDDKYFSNPVEIQCYLQRIDDSEKAIYVKELLDRALTIFQFINLQYRVEAGNPEIRITDSLEPNARAITWLIEITEGVIEHCVNTSFILAEEVIGIRIDGVSNRRLIGLTALTWVLAHEWIHVIRNHDGVRKELGSDADISKALEHDADLCAIAAIYRKFQSLQLPIKDNKLRELVIYCIFWTLRTFPETKNHEIHSPMEDRIYHMVIKIASLAEQNGDTPDFEFKTQAAQERRQYLFDVFCKCELEFINKIAHPQANYSLLQRWAEKNFTNHFDKVVDKWNEIKEEVGKQTKIKIKEFKEAKE